MKLKIAKTTTEIIETEFELPVYLHYQDDMCYDEFVKITEKERISIKYGYDGITFSISNCHKLTDYDLRNLTTKEGFEESHKELSEHLNRILIS